MDETDSNYRQLLRKLINNASGRSHVHEVFLPMFHGYTPPMNAYIYIYIYIYISGIFFQNTRRYLVSVHLTHLETCQISSRHVKNQPLIQKTSVNDIKIPKESLSCHYIATIHMLQMWQFH